MRTFAPTPHLFAQREKKGLLACNSSFRRSSNSLLLPLALSDGDRLGRQRVHSEARQSYFSVYLRPPALELCDFYSGSVVPKLDLVWRRIFIASGCEAVATPPCRAPHRLQCSPDEVPPGPPRRLIPSPLPTASLAWVGAGHRAPAPTVVASAAPSFQCPPQLPRGLPSRGRAGRRTAGLVPR